MIDKERDRVCVCVYVQEKIELTTTIWAILISIA